MFEKCDSSNRQKRLFLMFSKESGTKTGATVTNEYQIQLTKSICCRENPEAATAGVL